MGRPLLEALPAQREELDRDTLAFEHLMLGLRLRSGVDCGEYRRRFGRELDCPAFQGFCRRGWMEDRRADGELAGYTVTREGLLFLNVILERLLAC